MWNDSSELFFIYFLIFQMKRKIETFFNIRFPLVISVLFQNCDVISVQNLS